MLNRIRRVLRVGCSAEWLEPRTLLATFTVTNVENTGEGSLRKAIADANASPDADLIDFNIPGGGTHLILPTVTSNDPLSAAMPITGPVTIDGYTQPGASANLLAAGDNAVIKIQLDAALAPAGLGGVFISGSGVTVRGLSITHFSDGVIIRGGAGGNVIAGNFIGVNADGTAAGNLGRGVTIEGSPDNTVGGTNPADRNIISANTGIGVRLVTSGSTNNSILGNYIGTDPTGTADMGNGTNGVEVGVFDPSQGYASNTTIGGSDPGARNLISGNGGSGISLIGTAAGFNVIRGNYIGTDVTGTDAIPNDFYGINLTLPVSNLGQALSGTSSNNLIGGIAPGAGNLLSGNKRSGIRLVGSANNNLIQGNFIGTNARGNAPIPNAVDGIQLLDAADIGVPGPQDNTIGGTDAGAGNVISGNTGNGLTLSGPTTISNTIQGNKIGTTAGGDAPLKNNGNGVFLNKKSSGNLVGDDSSPGTDAPGGNTIAYNGRHGVVVVDGNANPIRRNSIFLNDGRGIDLGNDSFSLNDVGDADTGANDLQDYPAVTDVTFGPVTKTIEWTLNSNPNTRYTIDFFSNTEADPSGFGEGRKYLRSLTVNTNASGNAIFSQNFSTADKFISATATDPSGSTSEFSMVDTDGDGLPDGWETNGIDINEDKTQDLTLGSDPNKKDIFVEVDAMVGRAPTQATLNLVAAAFAVAPGALVKNPDGSNGIALHPVLDETNIPLAAWAAPYWPSFDLVKAARFGTPAERSGANSANILAAKALVYRYAVFADQQLPTDWSGLGELPNLDPTVDPHGRNDFMVTLGHPGWIAQGVTPNVQAGTFMHELGHTLGLHHGGGDEFQNKPNYHSVMNYTWQVPPPLPAGATARQTAYTNSWQLDYSRAAFTTLNENTLNEAAGIGGHAGHVVKAGPGLAMLVNESGPVDWSQNDSNGDGNPANDTGIVANVNGDTDQAHNPILSVLPGFEDWSQLRYYFLESPAFATGAHPHGESPDDEFTAEQYANMMPHDGPLAGRYVFYNRSTLDGNDPAAGPGDDAAIAADKGALLDGETASFRNVSSYSRGINGLMVDLALPPAAPAPPGAADFRLETGDGGGTWTPLAAAPLVSVRAGAGASGTDRVTLILPDGAVRNTWLKVTVLGTERTGLAGPTTFYFGNLVGDTGGALAVDVVDLANTRAHFATTGADATNPYDFNRDGAVNGLDLLIARLNQRRSLRVLTASATTSPAAAVPNGSVLPVVDSRPHVLPTRRRVWDDPVPPTLA